MKNNKIKMLWLRVNLILTYLFDSCIKRTQNIQIETPNNIELLSLLPAMAIACKYLDVYTLVTSFSNTSCLSFLPTLTLSLVSFSLLFYFPLRCSSKSWYMYINFHVMASNISKLKLKINTQPTRYKRYI